MTTGRIHLRRRGRGQSGALPAQLDNLGFLAQASTESQGPWDSNYQIEDTYSWFVPNRRATTTQVGFRYNYTELRRVCGQLERHVPLQHRRRVQRGRPRRILNS
jgi:hypothetical protein